MSTTRWLTLALLLSLSSNAFAQAGEDHDPAAILELGGATSYGIHGGWSTGPDVSVEVTPIEKWLELECGVTGLFSRNSTEWGVDLLFKKPWTLSKKVELMIGAGPGWSYTTESGLARNALTGEAVLDLMFWPSTKHKFGWFLEPGYEYAFGHEHEKSFGISAGLLIGIR
jgi:hypothetical protein